MFSSASSVSTAEVNQMIGVDEVEKGTRNE
jgi:hypothetical protein